MRPSLAAPLLPLSLSLLALLLSSALAAPLQENGVIPAAQNMALRELELMEERQAQAAEAAYKGVAAIVQAARDPAGLALPPYQPAAGIPPVVVDQPAAVVAHAVTPNDKPQDVLTTITDQLAAAQAGENQDKLTLTIERKDAEAALLGVETVRRGLESLEELLKSAASLTRLASFKADTPPEPPTLAPPPKPLADDPALNPNAHHAPPTLLSPDSDSSFPSPMDDMPDLMHNNHAHLSDLYYGAYPADELFYNKDVNNDLREPVPLVPVNVEKFRDYSAHPRLTAEEFFGRNRRKGAH